MNADVIKSTIQAVIDGLTPLAQKLGIAVEAIFGWAIKHNYAVAAVEIILPPLALLFSFLLFHWFYKQYERTNEEGYSVGMIFVGIGIAAIAILLFVNWTDGIQRLIAPEWFATKDIYEMIKGQPKL